MGLNCYKVQRIIHWVPPSDIEAYIQETGRGGWNGLHTKAILYNITSIRVACVTTNEGLLSEHNQMQTRDAI